MQRQRQLFIALAAAGIASGALAQGPTGKGGPDGSSLSINVVVTAKGEELFDSWDRPTGKPFPVVPVKVTKRGEFLSAIVLFKGCRPDTAGNCNVEMDITAFDPKGRTYATMPKEELWQAKPVPSPGFTQLSRGFMGIVIEPNDPPGTYRVTVVARDSNAKTEAKAETTFVVK
jgi:hypothetical protein